MGFRPLQDRVLLRTIEAATTTAGGILIPDSASEKPQRGEIVAVGPGRMQEDGTLRPLAVSRGDRVLFNKYAGTEIKIDGEVLLIMTENDLLGIVT